MSVQPKPQTFRSRSLTDTIGRLGAAREISCVDCGRADGTVVAAHSNFGKGMGIKASCSTVMCLCADCHSRLDQPMGSHVMRKSDRREYEREMNLRTLRMLIERGILVVA